MDFNKVSERISSIMHIKTMVYLFVFIFFVINLILSYNYNKYGSTTSPDIVHNQYFSDLFSKEYKLEYCLDLNNEVAPIYGARGLKITKNGCLSHGSMHGFIVLYGIFKAISNELRYLIMPLFSLLLLIYIYKLSYLLSRNKLVGLLSLFISGTSASFLYYSNLYFNNIVATSLIIGSIYYLLLFDKSKLRKYLILGTVLLSSGVWVRYEIIIFMIPLLIFILVRNRFKSLWLLIILGFLFAFPLLKINYNLAGNFFGLSNNLASTNYYFADQQGISLKSFLSLDILFLNIKNHLIFVYTLLFILVIRYFHRITNFIDKRFLYILVITIIINYFFYFIEIWSGFDYKIITISSSYSRYTLLGLFLIIIIMSFSFKYLKFLGLFMTFFWVNYNVRLGFNGYDSYNQGLKQQQNAIIKKENMLENFPEENAIIYTSYFDKYFFPDRIGGIYTSFPEKTRINDTALSIKNLVDNGFPVYFIESDEMIAHDIYSFLMYKSEIEEYGMTVQQINSGRIYKIF